MKRENSYSTNMTARGLSALAASLMLTAVLGACGGGGNSASTGAGTQPQDETPGPLNPDGKTVTGLYTFDSDRNDTENGPKHVSFKMFILDTGRVYAISSDETNGAAKNFYFGNGDEEPLMVDGQVVPGSYKFNSSGIRDLPLASTGTQPLLQLVSLNSSVHFQNLINGNLVRDGVNQSFSASYDQAFNSITASLGNIALGNTHRYTGIVAVGDVNVPGDIGILGIRVQADGNLIIENGCTAQSGKVTPHAASNIYEVKFSYKTGSGCDGDVFTGHAIVEKDANGDPVITLMAANSGFKRVLSFIGVKQAI
jgi:hypothetical protein